MNWFRENRFVGMFLITLFFCLAGALWFLFSAKSDWDDALTRFNQTAAELNRLERLAPYPSAENVRKMKAYGEDYATALAKLKDELKMRGGPIAPLAPNEFQSQLRVAITAVSEKARANKVKLPDKFYLGFDEFASALPKTEVAPLLGHELAQAERLLNLFIEARIDSLTSFRRAPLADEHGASSALPTPKSAAVRTPGAAPGTGPKLIERNVVETTFVSTPAAARKILNQIAGANQQFFIIRLLHVRNEKEKGPPREIAADTNAASAPPAPTNSPGAKPATTPATALNFIVGNERIETSAKIEIVRFVF